MQLGLVGLGRMGGNMARRLLRSGHQLVVSNRTPEPVREMVALGAVGAESSEDLVARLVAPRVVWLMVPAGEPTEKLVQIFMSLLAPGDILIDGGNSNYKDSIRRADMLRDKGIHFLDVGTSNGIWGLTDGYGMMIGGDVDAIEHVRPIFEALAPAPDKGWGRTGPSGAGHFTKMVHNGVEYGMMQAFAEGFEIMHKKREFNLDVAQIAEIWRHGSVVRSWLLDLTAAALAEDAKLTDIAPYVPDSGEGRWTVAESIDLDVPAPVITLSLMMRFVSRQEDNFAAKVLAVMRNQFGGHALKKEG